MFKIETSFARHAITRFVKFGGLSVASLSLAACVAYVPPEGADAKLKIAGDHKMVFISKDGSCIRTRVRPELDEVPVATGKRLWITQSSLTGSSYCGGEISFEPEAGGIYLTEFRQFDRQCNMRISRITPDGRRAIEPSARLGNYSGC